MLTHECTYCDVKAEETVLFPGSEARLKCLGHLAEASRFKDHQFIDDSVAAGVAH
jgi:hypothetical protein